MRLTHFRLTNHVSVDHYLLLALLATSSISLLAAPHTHTLLHIAVSSLLVWICTTFLAGYRTRPSSKYPDVRRRAWAAGILLVLANICKSVVGTRHGLWWAQALIPLFLLVLRYASPAIIPPLPVGAHIPLGSKGPDWVAVIATTVATFTFFGNPISNRLQTSLGLCSSFFTAQSLQILSQIFDANQVDKDDIRAHLGSNKTLLRRILMSMMGHESDEDVLVICLREFSASSFVMTAFAAYAFEGFTSNNPIQSLQFHDLLYKILLRRLWPTLLEASKMVLTVSALSHYGSYNTAMVLLMTLFLVHIFLHISLPCVLLAVIGVAVTSCAYEDPSPYLGNLIQKSPRIKHLVSLILFATIGGLWFSSRLNNAVSSGILSNGRLSSLLPAQRTFEPLQLPKSGGHPINYLVQTSARHFEEVQSRQSTSLKSAVESYKRRYGISPPPNFDKWYDFASQKDVQLLDEFDAIHHAMLPFWAFEPLELRKRVKEAVGYELNAFIALSIRDGRAVRIDGGTLWQRNATLGMIKDFLRYLPDMDVAFNIHDEPRVVIPHDELSRMIEIAKDRLATMRSTAPLQNKFSQRPKDMNDGRRVPDAKETMFNEYPHQMTWVPSILSCSVDSPARDSFGYLGDNLTSYAAGELGFIYNQTAFSDICMSPSLRNSFGFFNRPNAFKLSHELVPVFSQSKISSYQDIIYPSPWYWSGMVPTDGADDWHMPAAVSYDEGRDFTWEVKRDLFWWRGSTTGGFSRDGGWRRQHRQIIVKNLSTYGKASILMNKGTSGDPDWQVTTVPKGDLDSLLDIHFSGVGQCDEGDCEAMLDFFEMAPGVDMQEAWLYKYLLDMDGNAFSGRFYAFLESTSLVFKMAVFREWQNEWLQPWLHYVPITLQGMEHLETLRYFAREDEGKALAPNIALQGRQWARKVLRPADMEAYLFRLLLEYGRVMDDNREHIGYSSWGP